MKSIKQKLHYGLALAAVTLAVSSTSTWAADDIVISPSGTETGLSHDNGSWQNMWGPAFASITWDAATPPPTGDTLGAVYIQGNWTGGGQDNFCIASAGNWWGAVTFDASQYASIEMDIKYDTTSTIAPAAQAHLDIGFDKGYNFQSVTSVSFNVTSPIADGSWHHLSIPIPVNISGAGACHSVGFYQWNPSALGTMNFWAANVVVVARVVPTPPPTIKPLVLASKGLNVFNSTVGIYDRQEAMLRQTNDVGWVGQATPANPVSYSFTITDFPKTAAGNSVAYLFLNNNPGGMYSAPDWNETNCIVAYVQSSGSGTATMQFQYKVNNANNNAMYNGGVQTVADSSSTNVIYYTNAPGSMPGGLVYEQVSPGVTNVYAESGYLAAISDTTPLGTWTVKFTSDTDVTLITPNGLTTNIVIPAYNIGTLAPASAPLQVYLGGQANNADALNQAVVYSRFSISNSVVPFSENFLASDVLDTTNTWTTAVASGANGVFIVPANAAYWMTWTLPASGFTPEISPNLTDPLAWTSPANNKLLPMIGVTAQLLATSDLPAGNAAFFRLIKRNFTKLQILLPGETSAPGTVTGKTGTPTPIATGSIVNATINAVDDTFHIVSSTHTIHLVGSDSSVLADGDYPMASGTVSIGVLFQNAGSFTITASDLTDPTKTSDTSSAVTVADP